MHQFIFEPYTARDQGNLLDVLNVANEAKYGRLDNIDRYRYVCSFPRRSHIASVNALALNSTGQYLLSGGADSSVKLWDLTKETHRKDGSAQYKPEFVVPAKTVHKFGITHLKWWPDDGMWVSSSYDFRLNVWASETMQPVHSYNLESRVLNFDFDPRGGSSVVACCLDGGVGGVKLVDLRTMADSQNLGGGGKARGGFGYMLSCAWSPTNPNMLVSGGQDGYVVGWDIRASNGCLFTADYNLTTSNYQNSHNKLLFYEDTPRAHNGGVNSLLFNDTGTELITLGSDERIRVWDLTSTDTPLNKSVNFGPLVRNKTSQYVQMCLSPALETEMQYLWFPSDTGELLIYSVLDGKLVARLSRATEKNSRVFSIVYAGNNSLRYFAGCKDGSISVWGYAEGGEEETDEDPAVVLDNGIDYDNAQDKTVLDEIHDEIQRTN